MFKKLFLNFSFLACLGIISILFANQSFSIIENDADQTTSCTWKITLYGPAGTQGKICGPGGTRTCTMGSSGKCIFENLCNGTYTTCTVNGTGTVVINGNDGESNPSNGQSCTCPED